jgi:hypothetical protein
MESNADLSIDSEKDEDQSPQQINRAHNFPTTHVFRDEPPIGEGGHNNLSKSRIWLKEGDFDKIFKFLSSNPDKTRVTEKDIKTKLPFFK